MSYLLTNLLAFCKRNQYAQNNRDRRLKQVGYIDIITGESDYDSVVETKQPGVKLCIKSVIVGVSNEINP